MTEAEKDRAWQTFLDWAPIGPCGYTREEIVAMCHKSIEATESKFGTLSEAERQYCLIAKPHAIKWEMVHNYNTDHAAARKDSKPRIEDYYKQ